MIMGLQLLGPTNQTTKRGQPGQSPRTIFFTAAKPVVKKLFRFPLATRQLRREGYCKVMTTDRHAPIGVVEVKPSAIGISGLKGCGTLVSGQIFHGTSPFWCGACQQRQMLG